MLLASIQRMTFQGPALRLLQRSLTKQVLRSSSQSTFHPFMVQSNLQTKYSLSSIATAPNQGTSDELGTVTKTLKTLDMAIVRQIKAELLSVDVNADGRFKETSTPIAVLLRTFSTLFRIDADELKKLLRKHNSAFSDQEIIDIGELFYAGNRGESVSIERFIEAIDYVASKEKMNGKEILSTNNGVDHLQHFKDSSNHPLGVGKCAAEYFGTSKSHGHYTEEELDVKLTHVEPTSMRDTLAFNAVKAMRFVFDTATGWRSNDITTDKILNRVIYLETVAAVPGMVAAIVRHFKSLRTMQRDGGLLQMFLEEANNERMHLLSFVRLKDPSTLFRAAVIGGQLGFGTLFLGAYMISPKFCHRFVGYIEEEACDTYTKIINAIERAPEGSGLGAWRYELAPKIAQAYWKLGENGTVLDLILAVRADEAEHRDVNHLVCGLKEGQVNPLYDPQAKLDRMLLKYVQDIMTRNEKDGTNGNHHQHPTGLSA